MNELKRALPIVLVHLVIGLAASLVYAGFTTVPAELISPFVSSFRFRAAILLFIDWMPALQISGILVGYALAFAKDVPESVERWSGVQLDFLKGAFIVALVCISIYAILSEGVGPAFQGKQQDSLAESGAYAEYLSVARESSEQGDFGAAEFRANAALRIWPKSPEAVSLLESIRYDMASAAGENAAGTAELPNGDAEPVLPESSGLSVLSALDRARQAEAALDFYTAHYYAMLAYKLAPDTDPNKVEALRFSSRVWNRITSGTDRIQAEGAAALFAIKRQGYDAIQSGDYLRAYYILLSLQEQEAALKDSAVDPDVTRFLEIARQGVLKSFFFIDETLNLELFEASRNVFFVIRQDDGRSAAVFVHGLTYTGSGSTDVAYLRGFEYALFERDGSLSYQISVPYAKMFPYGNGKTTRPQLLLRSVDRNRIGKEIEMEVVAGSLPDQDRSVLLLDMPYEDLNLVFLANRGPSAMNLLDLMRFESKAERYGFSRRVYVSEILNRLADPFLILIVSVYALILGWKYRLGTNSVFKAWWILAVPLFPLISRYLIETVRYLSRVMVMLTVRVFPSHPLVLLLVGLSAGFVAISVVFFSQRSD
jgi:hypothetical protein